MAKQIKEKDIIVDDVFKGTIESTKELLSVIEKLDAKLIDLGKDAKKALSNLKTEDFKSIEKLNTAILKANELFKNKKKIDSERIDLQKKVLALEQQEERLLQQKNKTLETEFKAEIQLNKAITENEKLNQQKNKTQAESNKATKERVRILNEEEKLVQQKINTETKAINLKIKLTKEEERQVAQKKKLSDQEEKERIRKEKLNSLYNQQSKRLTELRNRAKEVGLQFGTNSKQFRSAQKEVIALDSKLKNLDASLGQSQRSVGRYERALGGLKRILSAAGIIGGVQLFVSAIRNSFKRIRDFDKELTNIAAVSGTTRDELKDLESVILNVSGASIRTSNEVAQLATVLFTLGKTKEEVKLLLKPINDLSIALGSTSEETADFLGQTLNAFGKGAESGQEFADVIANVRSSTSLDFERIKDAFGFVAPTANALGLTLGETSALIGTLQDNGIKAARAGRLLSSSFARLAKDGITLDDALKQIQDSQDKVVTATSLFGAESFTLGLILADNTEKVDRLANEFDNLSEGSLKELTDKQLDSLDAKLKILDSTWEQFLLSIENGEGFLATSFKNTIVFITENLSKLIGVVATLTTAFLSYKLVTATTRAALVLYEGTVKLLAASKLLLSKNVKKANTSMKAFNATTKANPIGALISVLSLVVGLFLTYRDNAKEAAAAQRELNDAQRESNRINESVQTIEERVSTIEKLNQDQLKSLLNSIDAEISANEEKQAKLLSNESAISDDSIRIREESANRIKEIEQEIAETSDEFKRQELRGSLQLFKQRLDEANNYAQIKSDIDEGITNKNVEENLIELQSNRKLVEERLKSLGQIKKSTDDLNKKGNKIQLIDRETSTRLEELKIQLKEIEQLREGLVNKTDNESKRAFNELTIQAEQLGNIIQIYEDRLKGVERDIPKEQKDLFNKLNAQRRDENDKLLAEAEERRQKEVKADLEAEQQKIANRQKTFEVLESLGQRQFDEANRRADEQLDQTRDREQELQNLAALGNKEAAASLGENQKAQALAEQKKEELLQKQKQFELALAVVNAFNAELDANPSGGSGPALAKAIGSTTVLTSFVSSLPAFKDGTEDTGNGGGLDGFGGFHAVLHPNERVLTKEQNSKIGGLKNDQVANIMDNYNKGLLIDLSKHNQPKLKFEKKPFDTNLEVIRKFEQFEKSIVNAINGKETYLGSDVDTVNKIITKTFKKGNKVVKQHQRTPKI